MSKQLLDKRWKAWLRGNLDRGCDSKEIYAILIGNNFSHEAIRLAMGEKYPVLAASNEGLVSSQRYKDFSETRITQMQDSTLNIDKVDTDKAQLYVIDDCLTPEQCDGLCALIDQNLRPSTITTGYDDKVFRTSSTCDLSLLKDPLVQEIDEKIARILGIRVAYSEGIQGQKYEVGQEFKIHTDYFEPDTEEFSHFAGNMGNRTWTFMIYLNDTVKGGGTYFSELEVLTYPKKGRAVVWNNLYPDGQPNPDSAHWGMPVEEGYKSIITKWFRVNGTGPIFYSE